MWFSNRGDQNIKAFLAYGLSLFYPTDIYACGGLDAFAIVSQPLKSELTAICGRYGVPLYREVSR
jgi:hypothetical protein